ncbi:MAG: sodium-dependent transporter, partial [Lachnospiraceae bacterium]|nr:sodium-dependent transporter [Lachnospiraceae bacterium]
LSLAGNGTVIYGSYLGRDVDAVSSARNIAIFDTVAALLAACVVIPAIFAFGMDPASGPPLMFITLPAIFQSMGSFGYIFSIIFFLAIFSAAASSIVNLYETPIEMVQETFKLPRKAAVAIIIISSGLIGLILENADYIGTWMDVMSIYLCPLGALLAAYCFYWVLSKKTAIEEMSLARSTPVSDFIYNLGKYAYCLVAIVVIVLGIALGGIG